MGGSGCRGRSLQRCPQHRSMQWVLAAHAVIVNNDEAQANFFHTKFGYAAPVAFPKENVTSVELTLRGVRSSSGLDTTAGLAVSVLYPGGAAPTQIAFKLAGGVITVTVELGGAKTAPCAMVLVTDSVNPPLLQP